MLLWNHRVPGWIPAQPPPSAHPLPFLSPLAPVSAEPKSSEDESHTVMWPHQSRTQRSNAVRFHLGEVQKQVGLTPLVAWLLLGWGPKKSEEGGDFLGGDGVLSLGSGYRGTFLCRRFNKLDCRTCGHRNLPSPRKHLMGWRQRVQKATKLHKPSMGS